MKLKEAEAGGDEKEKRKYKCESAQAAKQMDELKEKVLQTKQQVRNIIETFFCVFKIINCILV